MYSDTMYNDTKVWCILISIGKYAYAHIHVQSTCIALNS